MNKDSWEEIYDDIGDSMSRLRIPGGWLVRNYTNTVYYDGNNGEYEGGNGSITMCFVPDPNHQWRIE